MPSFQEFDVCSRGVIGLSESWKVDHERVRAVWGLEDLIESYHRCFSLAEEVFVAYCSQGQFPNPAIRFSYFSELLVGLLEAAEGVVAITQSEPMQQYDVDGTAKLRLWIDKFRNILAEDRFATDAPLALGSFSDWD